MAPRESWLWHAKLRNAIGDRLPSRLALAALIIWSGYVLLVSAWVIANPPFMAPDENSAYIRALAAGRGEFIGKRASYRASEIANGAPVDARTVWYFNATTRAFWLSSQQLSPALQCDFFGGGPFRCSEQFLPKTRGLERTPLGTYPPLPFVAPGLATRLASNSIQGVRVARAASAALVVILLLVVLLASADAPAAFVACGFAITPMVVFLAASVSTSSIEIAAGLCFAGTALRFIRDGCRSRWWLPIGLSGAILPLSRSAGAAAEGGKHHPPPLRRCGVAARCLRGSGAEAAVLRWAKRGPCGGVVAHWALYCYWCERFLDVCGGCKNRNTPPSHLHQSQ